MENQTSWSLLLVAAGMNAFASAGIRYRLKVLGPVEIFPLRRLLVYGWQSLFSWVMIGSLCLWSLAPFVYAYSLSSLELSSAHPAFVCVNFLFVVLLGVLLLREKITPRKMMAFVLAVIGIAMVSNG